MLLTILERGGKGERKEGEKEKRREKGEGRRGVVEIRGGRGRVEVVEDINEADFLFVSHNFKKVLDFFFLFPPSSLPFPPL